MAGLPGRAESRTFKDVAPSGEQLNFNRPHTTGREFDYIRQAIDNLHLSGNGAYTETVSYTHLTLPTTPYV